MHNFGGKGSVYGRDPKTVNRKLEKKMQPKELPGCSKTNRNQLYQYYATAIYMYGLCRRTLIRTKDGDERLLSTYQNFLCVKRLTAVCMELSIK